MLQFSLLSLLLLPILAYAQSSTTQSVQLSTSFSTGVTLGPNRAESTITQTFIITVAPASASATPSASGNNTVSGNSTASASHSGNVTSSASSSTTSSNLPTAPTDLNGGGQGGAPVPGATGGGGIYGPNDSYTADAISLHRNALVVGLVGFLVGGMLIVV